MTASDRHIEHLNSLLRGEIAATETYQQAIANLDATALAGGLRRMHAEHRESANLLRLLVRQCGGTPDHSSGTWGLWAKFVEGAAGLFGADAALEALEEGEERGVADYEAALQDDELPAPAKALIRDRLLPQTRAHIEALERMMSTMWRPNR